MFNAIALTVAMFLAMLLAAAKPFLCAAFLFLIVCFFVYHIFIKNGNCVLLIGKDDCELWDIYKLKEDHWWETQKGIYEHKKHNDNQAKN
jgi:hypothetical protein